MFDKDAFRNLLIKAKGKRNNTEYSEQSGVSRAYISGYINKSINTPPSPDIIKRLADKAHNDVSYNDLMEAAGHIIEVETYKKNLNNKYYKYFIDNLDANHSLSPEMKKQFERFYKLLESSGAVKDGEIIDRNKYNEIIEFFEFGVKYVKEKNKEESD